MRLDIAIKKVNGLITYFESYRDTGLSKVIDDAKEIAIELDIDPAFPQKREVYRKRQFDENPSDQDAYFSIKESFRVNYFLNIVDQALASLRERFKQYKAYEKIFGFLFNSDNLKYLDDNDLKLCCSDLKSALKNNGQSDIDANELYLELRLLNRLLPVKIWDLLIQVDCFPNAIIAYRILLTVPVTVASAKRSFSKLKLLKSYLRSTISQERLDGLALIAIENNLLESVIIKS